MFPNVWRGNNARADPGRSLGLATKHQIVHAHRGTILVVHLVGSCASFTIELPRVATLHGA